MKLMYEQVRTLYSCAIRYHYAYYDNSDKKSHGLLAYESKIFLDLLRNFILDAKNNETSLTLDLKQLKKAADVMTTVLNRNEEQQSLWLNLMFAAHIRYIGD